jgi:hypothetical protein
MFSSKSTAFKHAVGRPRFGPWRHRLYDWVWDIVARVDSNTTNVELLLDEVDDLRQAIEHQKKVRAAVANCCTDMCDKLSERLDELTTAINAQKLESDQLLDKLKSEQSLHGAMEKCLMDDIQGLGDRLRAISKAACGDLQEVKW